MKNRFKFIIILSVIAVAAVWYFIGMCNFHLGSNSMFFVTAFDYDYVGTVWQCEKLNYTAMVCVLETEQNTIPYMKVESTENAQVYFMTAEGDRYICVGTDSFLDFGGDNSSYTFAAVKYKKRFGKIYEFEMSGIDMADWCKEGNDTVVFKKLKTNDGQIYYR